MHIHHPFHRISRWNGRVFLRSSPHKAGITLNLGHSGRLCPKYVPSKLGDRGTGDVNQASGMFRLYTIRTLFNILISQSPNILGTESFAINSDDPVEQAIQEHIHIQDESEDEDDWTNVDKGGVPVEGRREKFSNDQYQCPVITVVDITGIHEIRLRFCRCEKLDTNPISDQLLRSGLFPSSFKKPMTAFTFRVLKDFDLANLEGKTAAFKYYAKLKRLSSNTFPHMITDRYRELLRVLRQWRDIQARQRNGEAFADASSSQAQRKGALALFCPACPQPGINLPEDWNKDKDQ